MLVALAIAVITYQVVNAFQTAHVQTELAQHHQVQVVVHVTPDII